MSKPKSKRCRGLYLLTPEGVAAKLRLTQQRYGQFVAAGLSKESVWKDLRRQVFLGCDAFVEQVQTKYAGLSSTVGVPKAQKRPPAPPLERFMAEYANRDEGIAAAYATGEYSYQQIADRCGLHFTTVGKIVRRARSAD